MDDDALAERLELEGRLLITAAGAGDWDAPVPALDWDVRAVTVHTGAVHRWAADIVRRALPSNETGGSRAFTPPRLADADIAAWFAEGLDELITTLRAAPADLACFAFLRDVPPRRFWLRRQLHETAIHRVDVQAATGADIAAVPVGIAQDGLGELVDGFARQRAFAAARDATLALVPSDGPARTVRFGGERNVVTAGADPDADAVVSGTSDELYRWAWNRPSSAGVSGDVDVLRLWQAIRI